MAMGHLALVLGNGPHLLGIMSHSGLCRIRDYVAFGLCRSVLCHSGLCRIRVYVVLGLMSFGIVSFGVMLFGKYRTVPLHPC